MQENEARKLDLFILNGYYREAVFICGSILESVLKDNVKKIKGHEKILSNDLSVILAQEKKLGDNKNIINFSLGQTVGLYREAKLLNLTEKLLNKNLRVTQEFLRGGRMDRMVEQRNNAAHPEQIGYKPSEKEAIEFKTDLNKILLELGYEPVIDESLLIIDYNQKPHDHYTFNLGGLKIVNIFIDENDKLWISDNKEEIKIYDLSQSKPILARVIPSKTWKQHFSFEWKGCYLCSDWDGGLYAINQNIGETERILRPGKFNHMPVRLLIKNNNNFLVAGTWDGKILIFDPSGTLIKTVQITHLPEIIIYPDESTLIVADEYGNVQLLSDGVVKLLWKTENYIKDLWVISFKNGNNQLVILETRRIVAINLADYSKSIIELENNVVAFSHNEKDYWTAIALSGGIIDWLSWIPFRLVKNNRVSIQQESLVNSEVKQLIVLYKPEMQHLLAAIGITEDGRVFSVNDLIVRFYNHEKIVRIETDHSRQKLLLVYEDTLVFDKKFIQDVFDVSD